MADAADVLGEVAGIGTSTRTAVLDRYPDLERLALADPQELTTIKGVGPATAQAIKDAVSSALEADATADLADADETTPRDAVAVASSTSEAPAMTSASVSSAAPGTGRARTADAERRPELPPPSQRARKELEQTLQSVRDAALAVGGVVLAAISAGRDQLPRVTDNLREAGTSATRTATSLLAIVKDSREDRS